MSTPQHIPLTNVLYPYNPKSHMCLLRVNRDWLCWLNQRLSQPFDLSWRCLQKQTRTPNQFGQICMCRQRDEFSMDKFYFVVLRNYTWANIPSSTRWATNKLVFLIRISHRQGRCSALQSSIIFFFMKWLLENLKKNIKRDLDRSESRRCRKKGASQLICWNKLWMWLAACGILVFSGEEKRLMH